MAPPLRISRARMRPRPLHKGRGWKHDNDDLGSLTSLWRRIRLSMVALAVLVVLAVLVAIVSILQGLWRNRYQNGRV